MNVSNINQEIIPVTAGMTYLTFFTNMPPAVILGAFTGSVIFLLGSTNKPKWQWLLYVLVSFLTGVLGARVVADIMTAALALLHIKAQVPLGFGGIVSAACTIHLLDWIRDHPGFFWNKPRGDNV